jgi:hypothetical protein
LAQNMQVRPCIPVLQKAAAGPTSGPARRLSHLHALAEHHVVVVVELVGAQVAVAGRPRPRRAVT